VKKISDMNISIDGKLYKFDLDAAVSSGILEEVVSPKPKQSVTVKKTKRKNYYVGQYFVNDGNQYVLARTSAGLLLINLHDGNRWVDAVKTKNDNYATEEEWLLITDAYTHRYNKTDGQFTEISKNSRLIEGINYDIGNNAPSAIKIVLQDNREYLFGQKQAEALGLLFPTEYYIGDYFSTGYGSTYMLMCCVSLYKIGLLDISTGYIRNEMHSDVDHETYSGMKYDTLKAILNGPPNKVDLKFKKIT
jgi:hypothetical protein